MNRRHVFLLYAVLLLCLSPQKTEAQDGQQQDGTFQKYSKWGVRVDLSRSFYNISEEEAIEKIINGDIDILSAFLANNTGPHINIYYNRRLVRFLYYQPELTYAIYNYPYEDAKIRSMFARVTPIQFQFGVHLGWARPYIFAGAHLDIAINVRDMAEAAGETEQYKFEDFGSRLYWGYTYGGGVDFLSFFQIQYRRNLWMNPFTSFTESMHLVDEALCLSFFF